MQESWKTKLRIERYGFASFGAKMVFSQGFGIICGFFEWLEILALENKSSCEDWKNFGDFW
jgi:hypothetical protein